MSKRLRRPLLTIGLMGALLARAEGATPTGPLVPQDQIQEVVALVEREYVRPVAPETLALIARERRLEGLDPYSTYLDPTALAQFDRDLAGSFVGIGVRLDEAPTDEGFRVRGPLVGSPALAAGVRAGDLILAVDGRSTRGWSLDDVLAALPGEPGTTVAIDVRSRGSERARHLTIRRETISLPSVRGARRAPGGAWSFILPGTTTGYLRLTAFSATTVTEFDAALESIGGGGAGSLVLDLRANFGGLSSAAVAIADRLIDVGRIVTYRERRGEEARDGSPGLRFTAPIAVLVDGETKSAGEILAAALQDHRRATIVGARTFGKATAQKVFRLEKGGAVKLTIATYIRPSGAPIERHGNGGDPERGGVWPDPTMAVDADRDQWARWRAELFENDERAVLALDEPIESPLRDDALLRRALAVLGSLSGGAARREPSPRGRRPRPGAGAPLASH